MYAQIDTAVVEHQSDGVAGGSAGTGLIVRIAGVAKDDRPGGLHGHGHCIRVVQLQPASDPSHRPASTDATDVGTDEAFSLGDGLANEIAVAACVSGIVRLVHEHCVGDFPGQFGGQSLALDDRDFILAIIALDVTHFGTEGFHDGDLVLGGMVIDHRNEVQAELDSCHGQADAGVAGRRLDDHTTGFEAS
ncbi:hypothetical protein D3C85_1285520 [compost metagenome]